ncbi:MAG: MmcQ/YjbR family DNA-binding protein [Saprospiraceae bacterium]
MLDFDQLHKIATSFPEVTVELHFDRISFKVRKKIFLTYHQESQETNLPFNPEQQTEFCEKFPEVFTPIANKWGEKGWTHLDLEKISKAELEMAIKTAYQNKAPTAIN